MKKLIPADTVDSAGNVWETVGENIRNGEKNFSNSDIHELIKQLYPIGSVYCGDNQLFLSSGRWLQIGKEGQPFVLGTSKATGNNINIQLGGESSVECVILRMWRRVG